MARAAGVALALLVLAWVSTVVGQQLDRVAPSTLSRGVETTVWFEGSGLEAVTDVRSLSETVSMRGWWRERPDRIRARLAVADRATLGPFDVELDGSGGSPVRVDPALEVVAGPLSVQVRPPVQVARGEAARIGVTGRNLDTVEGALIDGLVAVDAVTASSPVAATVDVRVGVDAPSGLRALVLRRGTEFVRMEGALEVVGGAPAVSSASPSSGVRGTVVTLFVTGENLERATAMRVGAGIVVEGFRVQGVSAVSATLTIREDAPATTRDVEVVLPDGTLVLPNAFTVDAGIPSIDRLRPARVAAGETVDVLVEGQSLDGVTGIDAGEGVTGEVRSATFPGIITIRLTATEDAALGPRTLTLDGPWGEATRVDAFQVVAPVADPPSLAFVDRVDVGEAEARSWKAGGFAIRNTGDVAESIVVVPVAGDADLFPLVPGDPLVDPPADRFEAELEPGAEATVPFRFMAPDRGPFGVTWQVSTRGGEVVGSVTGSGRGVRPTLLFAPAGRADLGSYVADETSDLPTIRLTLPEGVVTSDVLARGVRFELRRSGVLVPSPDEVMTLTLRSTTGAAVPVWGAAELVGTVRPGTGPLDGTVYVETSSEVAPVVTWRFTLVGVSTLPRDDVGPDAGRPDAGADATVGDATGSDAGDGADAGDTYPADAGGGSPDAPGMDGRVGGGGGCSAQPAPSGAWLWVVSLALVVRRRRA